MKRVSIEHIKDEVEVATARSGGAGGQHVNKVETKVQLRWNISSSKALTPLQKELILASTRTKLTNTGDLLITADAKRSQLKNKEIAFKKLDKIITKALARKKRRKTTQPSKAAKRKRLNEKRRHSEKKEMRKKVI